MDWIEINRWIWPLWDTLFHSASVLFVFHYGASVAGMKCHEIQQQLDIVYCTRFTQAACQSHAAARLIVKKNKQPHWQLIRNVGEWRHLILLRRLQAVSNHLKCETECIVVKRLCIEQDPITALTVDFPGHFTHFLYVGLSETGGGEKKNNAKLHNNWIKKCDYILSKLASLPLIINAPWRLPNRSSDPGWSWGETFRGRIINCCLTDRYFTPFLSVCFTYKCLSTFIENILQS